MNKGKHHNQVIIDTMSADIYHIGQWGETVAADFLERNGYTVLSRNYHTPSGEIDIVAVNQNFRASHLVFVEVKTRTSAKHGFPEEAITRKKWDHLHAAIQDYLEAHPDIELDWSVDVIAVLGKPGIGKPQIQHYEHVVNVNE